MDTWGKTGHKIQAPVWDNKFCFVPLQVFLINACVEAERSITMYTCLGKNPMS